MAALTSPRNTVSRAGSDFSFPVKAAVKCILGGLAVLNAGLAAPGSTATGLVAVGMFKETVDNTSGADSAVNVSVARGTFRFGNSAAADAITLAEVGSSCYIVDDQTVAKTNGTNTRSIAGIVRDVDDHGVWVEI